jgi:hypothetical protein
MLTVSDQLGRRCRPGAQFEKWHLNAFGFRGPDINETKPPGMTRVLVVGASETFGLYEEPGGEFPARLQRQLDQIQAGRFQVVNAGCPGMSPPRIAHALRSWEHRLAPDIVVFYPSPQFYLDEDPPALGGGGSGAPPRLTSRLLAKAKIALKSFLPSPLQARLREWAIERRVRAQGPSWVWTAAPVERVQLFRQHLTDLLDAIAASGAHAVLVTHASRFTWPLAEKDRDQFLALRVFYPRASEQAAGQLEQASNQAVVDIGRSRNARVVDAENRLGKDPALFADFSHFTDQGAETLARILADEIVASVVPGASNTSRSTLP